MRYSLLGRFQGALVGSLVGEILSSEADEIALRVNGVNENRLERSYQVAAGVERLASGQMDLKWERSPKSSVGDIALFTLPLALFFHESGQLERSLNVELTEAEIVGVRLMGMAIAHCLSEKNPQLLAIQDSPLAPVQILLEQRVGLNLAVSELSRTRPNPYLALQIAFYCFLSTPEDFRLSVSRAIRSGYSPSLTAALTGALSGAYNSITGIPSGWRWAIGRHPIGDRTSSLATRLLAAWGGVYQLESSTLSEQLAIASGAGLPIASGAGLAIAAPQVMQPR